MVLDGVPQDPESYEDSPDEMDVDAVGGKEKEEDKNKEYGYKLQEGYLCLSDSTRELVDNYAEEQGKSWTQPSDVYKMLANFIEQTKGSQPTSRPGPSGQ